MAAAFLRPRRWGRVRGLPGCGWRFVWPAHDHPTPGRLRGAAASTSSPTATPLGEAGSTAEDCRSRPASASSFRARASLMRMAAGSVGGGGAGGRYPAGERRPSRFRGFLVANGAGGGNHTAAGDAVGSSGYLELHSRAGSAPEEGTGGAGMTTAGGVGSVLATGVSSPVGEAAAPAGSASKHGSLLQLHEHSRLRDDGRHQPVARLRLRVDRPSDPLTLTSAVLALLPLLSGTMTKTTLFIGVIAIAGCSGSSGTTAGAGDGGARDATEPGHGSGTGSGSRPRERLGHRNEDEGERRWSQDPRAALAPEAGTMPGAVRARARTAGHPVARATVAAVTEETRRPRARRARRSLRRAARTTTAAARSLQCGVCDATHICDKTTKQCVTPATTCAELGATCGVLENDCGQTVNCGTCPTGQSCDATTHACGACTPQTCSSLGLQVRQGERRLRERASRARRAREARSATTP